MGKELVCAARFGGEVSHGKAMLETDYVLFRGDFRVKIPFSEMSAVKPRKGWLEIESAGGILALHLGDAAEKWAEKILNPPSRLDKLGVRPSMRIAVIGLKDGAFIDELAASGAEIAKLGPNRDIIFYSAEKESALARLKELAQSIKPDGAIWVIYPKGARLITEKAVIAAIRAVDLKDVKVASFSATHTALKAVIPRSRRNSDS